MLDVGRAYARIFGPSLYLDENIYHSYVSELIESSKPKTGFEKVPTFKPPYALGSAVYTEARNEGNPTRASLAAPKVCTDPDQQTYSDASNLGRLTLGPPVYCYTNSKRKWYQNKISSSEISYSVAFRGLSFFLIAFSMFFLLLLLIFLDLLIGSTIRIF